ncbi:MAG: hypothetical protein AAGN66_25625 [Acidobacteriota bacterium]
MQHSDRDQALEEMLRALGALGIPVQAQNPVRPFLVTLRALRGAADDATTLSLKATLDQLADAYDAADQSALEQLGETSLLHVAIATTLTRQQDRCFEKLASTLRSRVSAVHELDMDLEDFGRLLNAWSLITSAQIE